VLNTVIHKVITGISHAIVIFLFVIFPTLSKCRSSFHFGLAGNTVLRNLIVSKILTTKQKIKTFK